ncbi:hypothetical protein [Jiella marina]|uniref:hypothetical protein n=1 Tax=Jiella sp. LLJ827 TaxID=2917712 RepID=UPI002100A03A|nr:hypothetical protein [Jiella sp. LLJ827]MCQ0988391.1 hypothetical protein [Jiella sp. LLJ827]
MRRSTSMLFKAGVFSLAVLGSLSDASAFSLFEGEDGSGISKEGIIAVPLPPLPGTAAPSAKPDAEPKPVQGPQLPRDGGARGASPDPGDEAEGTDQGERPFPPDDQSTGAIVKPAAPADDKRDADADEKSPGADERGTGGRVRPAAAGDDDGPAAIREDGAEEPRLATPLPVEIGHGEANLPAPVRDLRAKLMEIARTGDIEKLRPYIETGADGTVLSFGADIDDPIEFLKSASGDGEGIEILAILLEVLESGYARTEPGSENEIYVWPYFTQVDLSKLTKPQLVELFELVTAGDYRAMLDFGAYNFYRAGITPEGKLQFFVAGD